MTERKAKTRAGTSKQAEKNWRQQANRQKKGKTVAATSKTDTPRTLATTGPISFARLSDFSVDNRL
jgi:hypothetical protein